MVGKRVSVVRRGRLRGDCLARSCTLYYMRIYDTRDITNHGLPSFMIILPWKLNPSTLLPVLRTATNFRWFYIFDPSPLQFFSSALLQVRKLLFLNSLMCRAATGQAALVLERKWATNGILAFVLCLFKHLSPVCLGKQICLILSFQLVTEFSGCTQLCSRVLCILSKLVLTCIFFINIDFCVCISFKGHFV